MLNNEEDTQQQLTHTLLPALMANWFSMILRHGVMLSGLTVTIYRLQNQHLSPGEQGRRVMELVACLAAGILPLWTPPRFPLPNCISFRSLLTYLQQPFFWRLHYYWVSVSVGYCRYILRLLCWFYFSTRFSSTKSSGPRRFLLPIGCLSPSTMRRSKRANS